MVKSFLRRAYDELVGMSQVVMGSGLDWTIVRFLQSKDGPARGPSGTASTAPTSSASASPEPISSPSPPPG
jgi:hypothetical protein